MHNKKIQIAQILLGSISISLSIILIIITELLTMENYLKTVFIIVGLVMLVLSLISIVILDSEVSIYECKNCKKEFKPTIKNYLLGMHFGGIRKLTCPHCGKRNFCKRKK